MRFKILVSLLIALIPLSGEPVEVKKSILSVHEAAQFKVFPHAVLNTKTKQVLVVWEKHPGNHPGHTLWGRLLNPQGAASGPEFVIVNGPNTYGPSLTYNAQRNEFLLVYANELFNQSFAVFAQRLNARGRPVGIPAKVSPNEESKQQVNNERPLVIWNERTGNYNIFWQKDKYSTSTANIVSGLYGAVLSGSTSVVQSPTILLTAKQDGQFTIVPLATDAAIHPVTGRLLLGTFEYAPGFGSTPTPKTIYRIGNLNSELKAIQPSNFTNVKQGTSESAGDLRFVLFADGNGLVVFPDSTNIKLRKIDMTGKLTGPLKSGFKAPLNNVKMFFPSLAQVRGSKGEKAVILGVRDPFNVAGQRGLWAQVLDSAGFPSGAPVLVDALADFSAESALAPLFASPTATNYRFVGVYSEGRQINIPPTASESSGLILLNLNFAFP